MLREEYMIPLQMECTLFFQMNPYSYESAEGLAMRLGRKSEHLLPVLERLVTLAILKQTGEGERSIYCYNQPDTIHVS